MRQIAVAVHSNAIGNLGDIVERFVTKLAEMCPNAVVLVGGYWGYMRDVIDNALRYNLRVVVILPLEREEIALPPEVIVVRSGCEYRCRSVLLVRSADAVAVLGGGVGTAIEGLMAYAMGKPLYVLANSGMATDRLREVYPEYFDERKVVRVNYVESPEDLAEAVCRAGTGVKTDFG